MTSMTEKLVPFPQHKAKKRKCPICGRSVLASPRMGIQMLADVAHGARRP